MRANEFVKRNPGLLKRAQSCKSLEEFLNLAKENHIEFEDISLEEAYSLLSDKQELSDDLLDNVAGGKSKKKDTLTRVDNPYEAEAWRATGHQVLSKYGDNFVVNK